MNNQGISLIEVVVSLFLLSFMLLGLDAMNLYSMRENKNAWIFTKVVNQLNVMTQELKAMKSLNGLDELIKEWNRENHEIFLDGYGVVSGEYPNYEVELSWGGYQGACGNNIVGISGCWKINWVLA